MSHLKQRKENNCLNCNAQLSGPFCHICGQENIEPKESVWHLITHFFNDITHFDGKFFNTLGLLIKKPGFLPGEYMLGRRASYLNPIRMYIFTSAIFFLIFFSFYHVSEKKMSNAFKFNDKKLSELLAMTPDSLKIITAKMNGGEPVPVDQLEKFFDSASKKQGIHFTGRTYQSKREYDSILSKGIKKHNWLERQIIYKEIEINEKYQNNVNRFSSALFSIFTHSFPQILFVSLPIFALLLKLLYIRRKNFYYVSHGIFAIHFYIFLFIAMLFVFGTGLLKENFHWQWLIYIQNILAVIIFFYWYKAMRNFYRQSRRKTIVKFLLLNFLSVMMVSFLMVIFIVLSFLKV